VLDVGEGTSVVVQTAHHVLVFGTGDVYGTDGRTAEAVLIPFLRSRGVPRIDALVMTERTPPASSGIAAVLAEMPVRQTLLNPAMPADFAGARHCRTESWTWDEVRFHVIRTAASVSATDRSQMCLVKVETAGAGVLIPGDVDARSERSLTSSALPFLAADLVIVPRHGSDSASTPELVGAVNAHWAVVSGRREREGRTKPAIARWEAGAATVVATADRGAIAFEIGLERPVAPRGERSARPRLWRSP
jgi:competence protein ComEC